VAQLRRRDKTGFMAETLPTSITGGFMADSQLTNEHAKTLLERLAKDNAFRSAFAAKPAAALRELGVDAETIVHLPAACLCPRTLASADDYSKLLGALSDVDVASAMQMRVPLIG
jgi:putative modified peptide